MSTVYKSFKSPFSRVSSTFSLSRCVGFVLTHPPIVQAVFRDAVSPIPNSLSVLAGRQAQRATIASAISLFNPVPSPREPSPAYKTAATAAPPRLAARGVELVGVQYRAWLATRVRRRRGNIPTLPLWYRIVVGLTLATLAGRPPPSAPRAQRLHAVSGRVARTTTRPVALTSPTAGRGSLTRHGRYVPEKGRRISVGVVYGARAPRNEYVLPASSG
ncbi:hypothetical protein F4679DRAFT_585879 [Xylaria curta]|nr:hypothetical protein F4679DRAFT_585879 [Xylaria curta]